MRTAGVRSSSECRLRLMLLSLGLLVVVVPLQPARAQVADASATSYQGRPVIGIGFNPTNGGIRVDYVDSGSSAQKAGVKSGMVITHINGRALDGLSIGAVEIYVAGLDGDITFTIREMGDVVMRKAPIEQVTG